MRITGRSAFSTVHMKFFIQSTLLKIQRLNIRIHCDSKNSSTKTKSMAVWGNHIQTVKIVINDNIIEQATDFKYLGYRISEYGSDLEDKLQTYNKINGATRRHFGKQMNKES
jgi:predicted SPOUT superfamily RNA methylase MTH1